MSRACWLCLALIAPLLGCSGDPLKRQAVSGSVTFRGEPLKNGMISFMPLDDGGSTTSQGIAIVDGEYKIPREKGLSPGKYRVLVTCPDRVVASEGAPGSGAGIPPKELIPAKYNENSILTATIEEKSGGNLIPFKLD